MKNPEAMNVDEIRTELVESFGYALDEVANLRGKQRLAIELQRARMANEAENNPKQFFSQLEVENNRMVDDEYEDNDTDTQELVKPKIGSPDWGSYVMAHLEQNELVDIKGNLYPKTAGLRRVAQILLGDIVESGPIMVDSPKRSDCSDRATVLYEIKFAWRPQSIRYIDLNDESISDRDIRCFREAADVWIGNTTDIYAVHPVATASTRAEGRALRKALQLNTMVAEEMENDKNPTQYAKAPVTESDGKFDDDALIAGTQKSMINRMCKRLNINVDLLMERHLSSKNIEALTKIEAASVIELLNAYQSKGKEHKEIPEEIKLK